MPNICKAMRSKHLNHWSATLHCDQFMTLFMHQEFAVNAFVALSSQTPDTICTDGTVGSLLRRADKEKDRFKKKKKRLYLGVSTETAFYWFSFRI